MTEMGQARTEELIARLVEDARPVRPLRPPLVRMLAWLAVAAVVIGIAVAIAGLRPGLAQQMADPTRLVSWLASLATGLSAAVAAFHVGLPDRSRAWALLPLPGLVLWLGTIGYGCLADWLRQGPGGLAPGVSMGCMISIIAMSVPLTGVFLVMMRHAGPVRPVATIATGVLATGGLAAAGLALFHEADGAMEALVWHGGTIAVLVGLATLFNRRLFGLAAPRPALG